MGRRTRKAEKRAQMLAARAARAQRSSGAVSGALGESSPSLALTTVPKLPMAVHRQAREQVRVRRGQMRRARAAAQVYRAFAAAPPPITSGTAPTELEDYAGESYAGPVLTRIAEVDELATAVSARLSARDMDRWTGIAIGLGVTALIGLLGTVLYMVWKKHFEAQGGVVQDERVIAGTGLSAAPSPVTIINQMGKRKKRKKDKDKRKDTDKLESGGLSEVAAQASQVNHDTFMRTIRLATNSALRTMTAVGNNPWRVTVRVLGPPGSYAAFATDASRLRGGAANAMMGEDVMIVPAGSEQEVRLTPRQVLYAIANTSGIAVSVVGSEMMLSGAPQLQVVR